MALFWDHVLGFAVALEEWRWFGIVFWGLLRGFGEVLLAFCAALEAVEKTSGWLKHGIITGWRGGEGVETCEVHGPWHASA